MNRRRTQAHLVALATFAIASFVLTSCIGNDAIIAPSLTTKPIQSMDLRSLGLTATVQMSRQDCPGYVSVRLVLAGIGAVPADQLLMFRFATHPGGETPPGNRLVVDVPVTIPQGSKTTTVTRYFPKWTIGHFMDVTIYEDGRLLEDSLTQFGPAQDLQSLRLQMSKKIVGWSNLQSWNVSKAGFARECRQDWLFIDKNDSVDLGAVPDLRNIIAGEADAALVELAAVAIGLPDDYERTNPDRNYHAVGQADLPTDWRGYQSYDAIVTSFQSLRRLSNRRESIDPIRHWILQGGTAVVYDSEDLHQVMKAWRFGVAPNRQLQGLLSPNWINRHQSSAVGLAKLADQDITGQSIGAGLVLTISSDANQSGKRGTESSNVPSQLRWARVKRLLNERSSTMLRDGADPIRGHSRFRNWTIPGVLQPPVYTFIGVLSLFVVLVGPVAYRQTTKHGRGHLMFAIAPILAIVTTLAMLGYGVIADGFETQARVRQLTWVDGASGDAGERVLATYFAGIRPSAGLRFPADATVFRQAEPSGVPWNELKQLPLSTLGTITVTDEAQQFDSSFLPSREQRQFIVHSPRTGIGSIELQYPSTDVQVPSITSTFKFPIRNLIVRDQDGQYWSVEQLSAGGTETCTQIDTKIASKRLGNVYNQYRPVADANTRESGSRESKTGFDALPAITRDLAVRSGLAAGIFENWLSSNLQMSGELPLQHFVAVSDVSSDILAVDGARVVDSVRYVFGTLR